MALLSPERPHGSIRRREGASWLCCHTERRVFARTKHNSGATPSIYSQSKIHLCPETCRLDYGHTPLQCEWVTGRSHDVTLGQWHPRWLPHWEPRGSGMSYVLLPLCFDSAREWEEGETRRRRERYHSEGGVVPLFLEVRRKRRGVCCRPLGPDNQKTTNDRTFGKHLCPEWLRNTTHTQIIPRKIA